MAPNVPLVAVLAVVTCLALWGLGYAIGATSAPGVSDSQATQRDAYVSALRASRREAYATGQAEGRRAGLRQGKRAGAAAGAAKGAATGGSERLANEAAAATKAKNSTPKTNADYLSEMGCDPTYIFPDGSNGCTHNYGD